MANLDDDPLAGFISDGSDDSFFDEPKKSSRKSSTSKLPQKSNVSDLFMLNTEEKSKPAKKDDWLGLGKVEETSKKLIKKTSFENEDVLNSLGIDKVEEKNMVTQGDKKSTLMESLFGPLKKEEEKVSTFDDILKESKKRRGTTPPPERNSDSKEVIDPPRERRSRHLGSRQNLLDPLGLLSESTTAPKAEIKPKEKEVETEVILPPKTLQSKSTPNMKSIPTWLGGKDPTNPSDTSIEPDLPQPTTEDNLQLETLQTQQKLATAQIEFQNTSYALQQQENQLLVAVQLKKYEENLMEMQRKQHHVLTNQEQKFNSLLENQFARQQIMENNMRMQQERINSHIQMLLAQPSSGINVEKNEKVDTLQRINAEENSTLYEEIIKTLKERQHEERFILEESYKKQINLLEQSMSSMENQLKEDFANVSQQYRSSLDQLKEDHSKEMKQYQDKILLISNSHAEEMKLMRENHNRIIEEIKYEYNTLVENLKNVKHLESSAIENASQYSQKLDQNLQLLVSSSLTLSDIRGKVEDKFNVYEKTKEESLKVKEEEIKQMRLTLEKARESAELERSQLMGLVKSLEVKLMELRQNENEDRWALQQATALVAARSSAFDREVEFTRSTLKREEEQLKTLKEVMLSEQEKLILHLTEEKLALAAEKSRLETSGKLQNNFEIQKAKVEMEAAIKVAQDSTEATNNEREILQKQQIEVELLKRNLIDRERKLSLREHETLRLVKDGEKKEKNGEIALMEARNLEDRYQEKLKEIQCQLVSLTKREKKLAEEKILLSKERLSLHNNSRQRCALCTSENLKNVNNFRQNVIPDADIERLRHEIIEDVQEEDNVTDS